MEMDKNKNRPVYLNLFQIRLPVGGVMSILHRITGAVLVLLLPFAIYMLQRSLQDPERFADIVVQLGTPIGRSILLAVVWVFAQHFFSGVRHLLQDVGIGLEITAARRGAWLTFIGSGLVVVVAGACL